MNQTDTFVFVTDEERVIRWNNRAMGVLLPFADDASSWIGKPCREVCARVGHAPTGEVEWQEYAARAEEIERKVLAAPRVGRAA